MKNPQVVGTVHSAASLAAARRLRRGKVDFLELRVDHFAENPVTLLDHSGKLKKPLIITARHPAEGGAGNLKTAQRQRLYEMFMPLAAMMDIELRSTGTLDRAFQAARAKGIPVIISAHDFTGTPGASALEKTVRAADKAGADIIKIACRAETLPELQRLLALFSLKLKPRLSVMAMGRYGKVSRLLFAQAGSVLNYGYLATPNASGQWPAEKLAERIAELS